MACIHSGTEAVTYWTDGDGWDKRDSEGDGMEKVKRMKKKKALRLILSSKPFKVSLTTYNSVTQILIEFIFTFF